ncbi:vegetative cell wall protein gp1-like [Oncorhynchus kisutch]|uniref:vegetative cell wall protein gp1-like n=1 Tax=Oncorhynchus kisutch TaxID=8019 RepID=UPI0012DBD10A|nr:vegetative cell wall protein gp1-like [Oncorhynchus kisutch]
MMVVVVMMMVVRMRVVMMKMVKTKAHDEDDNKDDDDENNNNNNIRAINVIIKKSGYLSQHYLSPSPMPHAPALSPMLQPRPPWSSPVPHGPAPSPMVQPRPPCSSPVPHSPAPSPMLQPPILQPRPPCSSPVPHAPTSYPKVSPAPSPMLQPRPPFSSPVPHAPAPSPMPQPRIPKCGWCYSKSSPIPHAPAPSPILQPRPTCSSPVPHAPTSYPKAPSPMPQPRIPKGSSGNPPWPSISLHVVREKPQGPMDQLHQQAPYSAPSLNTGPSDGAQAPGRRAEERGRHQRRAAARLPHLNKPSWTTSMPGLGHLKLLPKLPKPQPQHRASIATASSA